MGFYYSIIIRGSDAKCPFRGELDGCLIGIAYESTNISDLVSSFRFIGKLVNDLISRLKLTQKEKARG